MEDDVKKYLRNMGRVIVIIGIIAGLISMATNVILGVGIILSSIFWLIICDWLWCMLDYSGRQISLLNDIKNKLEE